jgi:hypothetical protein
MNFVKSEVFQGMMGEYLMPFYLIPHVGTAAVEPPYLTD